MLLFLTALYLALGLPAHGIYWDEYVQSLYGRSVLEWYASGFQDRGFLELGNLRFYGGVVESLLEAAVAVVPGDPYLIRHVGVALFCLTGLWATWRLGSMLGGGRLGLIAMALLAASPRYLGHGFFNSKDVPTAALYALTLFFFARELRRPAESRLGGVVVAGVALGLLLGTRLGAAVVLPAIVAGYGWRWWNEPGRQHALSSLTVRLAAALLIAWPVMLIAWPWAIANPVLHPLAAFLASGDFPFVNAELFQGRFVNTADLPWSYVPVWLGRTLPEVTLVGLVSLPLMLALRKRGRARPETVMVATAGLLPLVYVVGTRAPLYDGIRHLLFLQPMIALASAAGLCALGRLAAERGRWPRRAAGVALVAGFALPVVEMARLAPYEYVYFNHVSGGLPAAAGRFELDYWGLSYKEGVAELSVLEPSRATRIASCSHPGPVQHVVGDRFEYLGSYAFEVTGTPERVLLTAPHDCALGWPPATRPPVAGPMEPLVQRRGVPLLYVVPAASSDHAEPGNGR